MTKKRIFAVSDVHGHCSLMKKALDEAGFEPENDQHLLIFCGDLFDRGRENREVYDFFRKLNNKVLIRGNHDDRLLNIIKNRRASFYDRYNGAENTLKEFFGENCLVPIVEDELFELKLPKYGKMASNLRRMILSMIDYYETEHYIFVHGWLPTVTGEKGETLLCPDWRAADEAMWTRARTTEWLNFWGVNDMIPEKTIVCGHRPTRLAAKVDLSRSSADTSIYFGERMIALDAGTVRSGRVNILVIEDELLIL